MSRHNGYVSFCKSCSLCDSSCGSGAKVQRRHGHTPHDIGTERPSTEHVQPSWLKLLASSSPLDGGVSTYSGPLEACVVCRGPTGTCSKLSTGQKRTGKAQ
nr:hypothetical protein CFP56_55012 [Quercus suber]